MKTDSTRGTLRKLAPLLGVLCFLIALNSVVADVTRSNSIEVQVNVAEETIVNINPKSLIWIGNESVYPGSSGTAKQVQVENIGSTNISYIWFNNSYPSSNPFGSGIQGNYDAGNFVAIKRTTDPDTEYSFPNRVDYKEDYNLIYVNVPTDYRYGRFRYAGEEYFWAVDTAADVSGDCNGTGTTFCVGKQAHDETQEGSTDLTSCDATLTGTAGNPCRCGTLTQDATQTAWAYGDVYVGNNTGYHNYTVAVHQSCNTTMWMRWNKDGPGAGTASHVEYYRNETLVPGAVETADVKVYVPYGTASGNSTNGTLYVIAMALDVSN
jgi:hypothetical protein